MPHLYNFIESKRAIIFHQEGGVPFSNGGGMTNLYLASITTPVDLC